MSIHSTAYMIADLLNLLLGFRLLLTLFLTHSCSCDLVSCTFCCSPSCSITSSAGMADLIASKSPDGHHRLYRRNMCSLKNVCANPACMLWHACDRARVRFLRYTCRELHRLQSSAAQCRDPRVYRAHEVLPGAERWAAHLP